MSSVRAKLKDLWARSGTEPTALAFHVLNVKSNGISVKLECFLLLLLFFVPRLRLHECDSCIGWDGPLVRWSLLVEHAFFFLPPLKAFMKHRLIKIYADPFLPLYGGSFLCVHSSKENFVGLLVTSPWMGMLCCHKCFNCRRQQRFCDLNLPDKQHLWESYFSAGRHPNLSAATEGVSVPAALPKDSL